MRARRILPFLLSMAVAPMMMGCGDDDPVSANADGDQVEQPDGDDQTQPPAGDDQTEDPADDSGDQTEVPDTGAPGIIYSQTTPAPFNLLAVDGNGNCYMYFDNGIETDRAVWRITPGGTQSVLLASADLGASVTSLHGCQ